MLDIRLIRERPEWVREQLARLHDEDALPRLERVITLDVKRREALSEAEKLQAQRNRLNRTSGRLRNHSVHDPKRMPTGSVLANAPRHGRLSQIIEAKRIWDVSAANLTYRMHKVGLLTDWEYRTLFTEISRHGYRRREPNPARGENSQVLAKVFGSLRDDGVTMSQVAKKLKIYPDELSRAVFGLVLTPITGGARPDSRPRPEPQLRVV